MLKVVDTTKKKGVLDTIKRFSIYNGASKAGVYDNKGWYKYGGDKRRLIQLVNDEDYQHLVKNHEKRILGTLNYFRPSLFHEWQEKTLKGDGLGGLEDTWYYMLSIDVDLANDYTVDNPKALESLEKVAKFIEQELRKVINNKFLIMFSGNGIYFHLHPEFAASDETNDVISKQRADELQNILDSFNLYIQELEKRLFQDLPEVHGIVKVDAINNRKRVFKLPLTTHKDLPYLVYPIDANKVQIQLKTIPLSDIEVEEAKSIINDFFDGIPDSDEHQNLSNLLKSYSKPQKRNSDVETNVNEVPPVPLPIDIIKEEKICGKIFEHKSWPKGNTRRVAFMTAVLGRSGWETKDTKKFVSKTANDWNISALEHVIDSWLDFDPPNIKTIYNIGSDYPEMTMGDLRDYLPLKPDYSHVMDEIFRLARNKGFQVPESELKDGNNECRDIKLKYGTEHLFGFNDLETATSLFGMEYKIAFKVLWYTLASFRIAMSRIKAGNIELDGRISPLFVLPAGRGKNQIKTVIKKTIQGLHCVYGEPTSLHAEQLVGKTIKNTKTGEFYHNRGYLNDDYVVIDEAYQLLTSSDLKYAEARKYIRVALDPYPNNTVHKRTTEYGREGALEFNPHCPVSLFVQPIRFENEILVLEGDIRRFTIAYPLIQSSNVTETLRRRIFDESDNNAALDNFIELMSSMQPIESFQFSEDAKKSLEHLSNDLYKQGVSYSHKIACLNESIIYTSQNTLVKFSAIQAFQHGRSTVEKIDVILAYMDLFEIMEHTYKFIEAKIPGSLDYGEGWNGAVQKDQQVLQWLHGKGANSKANAIPKQQYIDKIKELFGIETRQAESVYKKHFEVDGWIGKTKKQKKVFVWLKFQPDECNNCTVQSGLEFEYETYIQCYEHLLIEEAQKELHTANITIKEEAG